jgi:hypothetical protein
MNIVLKDKIKIDNNFITDLITKSWQDSESIQNQINSIEIDSPQAARVVKLLKDLLTSYYVFTGCLENIEYEPNNAVEQEITQVEEPISIPEESATENVSSTNNLDEFDTDELSTEMNSEPFEYFVDFDEPIGEPLTDKDLYN